MIKLLVLVFLTQVPSAQNNVPSAQNNVPSALASAQNNVPSAQNNVPWALASAQAQISMTGPTAVVPVGKTIFLIVTGVSVDEIQPDSVDVFPTGYLQPSNIRILQDIRGPILISVDIVKDNPLHQYDVVMVIPFLEGTTPSVKKLSWLIKTKSTPDNFLSQMQAAIPVSSITNKLIEAYCAAQSTEAAIALGTFVTRDNPEWNAFIRIVNRQLLSNNVIDIIIRELEAVGPPVGPTRAIAIRDAVRQVKDQTNKPKLRAAYLKIIESGALADPQTMAIAVKAAQEQALSGDLEQWKPVLKVFSDAWAKMVQEGASVEDYVTYLGEVITGLDAA